MLISLKVSQYFTLPLKRSIRELRENGDIVIEKLPEDNVASLEESFRLDEELICINGVWTVAARTSNR